MYTHNGKQLPKYTLILIIAWITLFITHKFSYFNGEESEASDPYRMFILTRLAPGEQCAYNIFLN